MSFPHTDKNGVGILSRSVDFGRLARYPALPLLSAIAFLLAAWLVASYYTAPGGMSVYVIAAAVIGGYMAMNIGANDVANNVAAAVGSRALTLGGAIVIAAIFETAGALIAGGDVVSTISKGIIDPSFMADTTIFILAMGSALLAGAVWLNLATWVGAPVSTTHSIVGGVLGGGIAAAGFGVVDWEVMSKIAASWFISPVLGGVIAATFLAFVNRVIFSHTDMLASSRRWLPVLIGIMAGAFAMYLTMKGLKRIWKAEGWMIMAIGVATFSAAVVISRPILARASQAIENRRKDVNALFNLPLVGAAALLAFAHGANDVANAIGPLSAIASVAGTGIVAAKVGIPLWIMLIGAAGIAVGLALYGAKLIRTIGRQLTTLDQSRAFCIALSTAITVIAASALALPVSTTHITVGAVFGVGFYRELLSYSQVKAREARFALAGGPKGQERARGLVFVPPKARFQRRKLVRRAQVLSIISAWIITVPSAAVLSALIFFIARITIVD